MQRAFGRCGLRAANCRQVRFIVCVCSRVLCRVSEAALVEDVDCGCVFQG